MQCLSRIFLKKEKDVHETTELHIDSSIFPLENEYNIHIFLPENWAYVIFPMRIGK